MPFYFVSIRYGEKTCTKLPSGYYVDRNREADPTSVFYLTNANHRSSLSAIRGERARTFSTSSRAAIHCRSFGKRHCQNKRQNAKIVRRFGSFYRAHLPLRCHNGTRVGMFATVTRARRNARRITLALCLLTYSLASSPADVSSARV